MADDIIGAFIRRLEALGISHDQARRIGVELRQEWGGTRTYVPKSPVEKKSMDVGDWVSRGVTLTEAFERAGCGRSQGYAYLRLRRR